MTRELDRRSILSSIGATAGVAVVGSQPAVADNENNQLGNTIPFDLRIQNKDLSTNTVKVDIYEANRDGADEVNKISKEYTNIISLKGIKKSGGNALNSVKENLDLKSETLYLIEATIPSNSNQSGMLTVATSHHGVPDYEAYIIDVSVGGDIRMNIAKM